MFIVNEKLFAIVTLALMVVAEVLVVVVAAPPFKFKVVADALESANVSDPVPVGAIAMVPPEPTASVAAKPLGIVIN